MRLFLSISAAVLIVLVAIWISAAGTVLILDLAHYLEGIIGNFLIDKGPERLMRRILMILTAVILFLIMKRFGWRGWKDCGWNSPAGQPSHCRWTNFLAGIAIGFITLGSLAGLTLLTGLHKIKDLHESLAQTTGVLLFFALSGLSVALIEETICRGILFRVFARTWNAWTAALFTSVVFALAHFIGPGYTAFQGDSFLAVAFHATTSTLASLIPPPHSRLHFLNLVLLSIVLCAFVGRTKTIWLSVGAHAAWVAIIKTHAHFTDFNTALTPCIWQGKRNDFMDSLTATVLFAALIILTLWNKKGAGASVMVRGQLWHVIPSGTNQLDNFLKTGESFFNNGRLLKAYQGCRVVGQEGLVLKKYWPKNLVNRLRFALRPPRSRRAFLLAGALIARGLPTPPVLAWSSVRRFGLLMSEAMIVSAIKDAVPLTAWLEKKSAENGERLKVMAAYGSLMADFHSRNYSNRDLKHENVMCAKEKPWLLWVVDMDGVRKHLFISRRRAGRDLMRVGKSLASLGWANAAETAAFFEAYNRHVPTRLRRHAFPGQ